MLSCRGLGVLVLGSVVSGALAQTPPPDSAPLDTLFYTPQERKAITLARKGVQDAGPESSLSRYQGIVRRSAGKNTLWINGKALPQGAPGTPATVGLDALVDGTRLRVGQALDTSSGERSDVVVPGAVTLQKAKTQ